MKWIIFFSSLLAFSSCRQEQKEFEELQHICEKNLERQSRFIYTDNAWRAPFLEKELRTLYTDFNQIRFSAGIPELQEDSLKMLFVKHGKRIYRMIPYQNESILQYFPDPVKTSFPGFERINLLLMKNYFAEFYGNRLIGPCFTPSNSQIEPIITCFSAGDSITYLHVETYMPIIHWIKEVEFCNRKTLRIPDSMQWMGKVPVPASLSGNVNPYDRTDVSGIVESIYNFNIITGKKQMIIDHGQYVPQECFYELFR